jgi:outer membrane protein TolC
MRWKHAIAGLALALAGIVGCRQQCFLHECDADHYPLLTGMPKLECDPSASIKPATLTMPKPTDVNDPDRPIRPLTLAEAIALALENGTTGSQAVANAGLANDNLLSFTGSSVVGSDSIRVLSLDPSIVAANIEDSLSKFDAQWNSSITWNTQDLPPQSLNAFTNGETAQFVTSLLKPLPTGGVAGITFSTQYQFLAQPVNIAGVQILNPSYSPQLQFQFEQPLLQGAGVEINQLRATHPGSVLTPFPNTGGRVEGILITRIRFDQQRAEFERNVHFMLLNVETAYWNLYGAYWTLYAQETGFRQTFNTWQITRAKYEQGQRSSVDLAQTRQQFELFRGQRLTALGQVLENERQLRALLGLPGEDGTRLVPIDAPTLTPYQPDWSIAVNEAMALRPELVLARQDLKFRQLDLINVKNLLMPDLRFTSTYALNGLGTHLDGSADNALRSLASDQFTNWSLGLRLNVPIGFRDAHVQVRQAHENLARSYLVLRDQELKAQRYLEQQYRRILEFHDQIEIQRAQRLAAADWYRGRLRQYVERGEAQGGASLDILLEAIRAWSNALTAEYQAIAQYNGALAAFEFAKGTIMQYDSVTIGEGPLPQCAQVRAVEHERQRSKALILRERARPIPSPDGDPGKGCCQLPQLPTNEGAPLGSVDVPSLLQQQDPPGLHPELPTTPNDQAAPQPLNPPVYAPPLSGSLNKISFPPLAMPTQGLDMNNVSGQPQIFRPATLSTPVPAASGSPATPMLPEDGWKKAP